MDALMLGDRDLVSAGLYDWARHLRDLEAAFAHLDTHGTVMPPKVRLQVAGRDASWTGYVAYWAGAARVSLKWLTRIGTGDGEAPIEGLLILSDAVTGSPVAVMQAGRLTAVRTAATSALACRYLAPPDAQVAAVLGAGAVAAHHIRALAALRPGLRTVVVWNRSAGRLQALLQAMESALRRRIAVAATAEEAVRAGEILVCALAADRPVVKAAWVREGTCVIDVGERTCESDLIAQCGSVYVDWRGADWTHGSHSLTSALMDGGLSVGAIAGDLTDLIAGRVSPWPNPGGSAFFASAGLAIEDLALASRLYDEALRRGIGQTVALV